MNGASTFGLKFIMAIEANDMKLTFTLINSTVNL